MLTPTKKLTMYVSLFDCGAEGVAFLIKNSIGPDNQCPHGINNPLILN
jgi:hypothetical protein